MIANTATAFIPQTPVAELARQLRFDTTIDRRLVHRTAIAEVFLTDWRQLGENSFCCAAQWPRGHSLYGIRDGRLDSMLVPETIRQIGILLGHVGYRVPQGHSFVMNRLRWRCRLDRMRAPDGPLDVVATVEVHDLVGRADKVGGYTIEVRLWHQSELVAEGSGAVRCVPPAVYQRLRWGSSPRTQGCPPAVHGTDPASVGRDTVRDVVLGEEEAGGFRPLRILTDHPVLFDHRLDHVPGMLAVEAMRQAAVAACAGPFTTVQAADATFHCFLDLDQRCRVVAVPPARDTTPQIVGVRLEQNGRVAVDGWVECTSY